MKKIFILFYVGSISLCFGQSFTLSPNDTIEGTYPDNSFAYDYIYVDNNSGGPLTINFTLISNTCISNGWFNNMCTNVTCYSNVPSSGSLGAIPNGGQGYFRYQCGFDGFSGTGWMRLRVYESGNPSNADTLTYLYHVYNTASIENSNANATIKMYPNPAIDILNIQSKYMMANGFIQIRDISGKIMLQQLFISGLSSIQVSQFPAGVYFASVYDGNNIVYSGKFLKE